MYTSVFKSREYNLHCPDERPGKKRFFVFHHAGGSAGYYLNWGEFLSQEYELRVLELPGRGASYGMGYAESFEDAVEGCYQLIQNYVDEPFAFFGHSLGAHLAYAVSCKFWREKAVLANLLILSATKGPNKIIENPYKKKSHLCDEKLVENLKSIGNFPVEIDRNPALRKVFLSIVRRDYQLFEGVKYHEPIETLPCEIQVMAGENDIYDLAEIEDWINIGENKTRFIVEQGEHFYFDDNIKRFIKKIYF